MINQCKNCNHEFIGEYCNLCGQKVMNRLTIRSTWDLIVDDVFEVNRGLLYTLKELWINPGKVSLDFVHGNTKKYYSPIKYLIFWLALLFLINNLVGPSGKESTRELIFNSTIPFSSQSIDDFWSIYMEVFRYHIDLFYYGLIPFLTLVSYFIYRRKGFNLVELSILYLYMLGQLVFILVITMPIAYLLGKNASLLLLFPEMVLVFYLFVKSHKQFFKDSWIKTILKSFAVLYIGQILYGVMAYLALNLLKL
jgi:hypothetical protein